MVKLLRAEFKRLFKNKLFIFINIISVLCGASMILVRWNDYRISGVMEYDDYSELIFVGPFFLYFAVAALIALFIGTEFSDGTIRNKLLVGHDRHSVYFTELLVSSVANIIIMLLYVASNLLFGVILLNTPNITVENLILKVLMILSSTLVLTSFFTFISLSAANKSVSAVMCLLLSIFMLFGSIYVTGALNEPEIYETSMMYDTETGEFVAMPAKKNPNYISGSKRVIFEVINDVHPVSQLFKAATEIDIGNYYRLYIFDFTQILLYAIVGSVIFKKKDLK